MNRERGQSLIEVVFSVGILALVLVAVVSLLVTNFGGKTSSFERKKASELAEVVVENYVTLSKNDPLSFWQLTSQSDRTINGFPGYVYSIGFTNMVGNGCGVGVTDCADLVVRVGWSGKEDKELIFDRFFSRR